MFYGAILTYLGLISVLVFSVLMLCSNNLIFFWLFMELVSLCSLPVFFMGGTCSLMSLVVYLVASGISSIFILSGVVYEDLIYFLYLGFAVKFGVFPLWGWVYNVVLGVPWLGVWIVSCVLKVPVFYLNFFLVCEVSWFVDLVVFLSFVVLGIMFWVYNYSLRHCWCHMMLSSGYVLYLGSFVLSFNMLVGLFTVFLVWCSIVVGYLYYLECGEARLVTSSLGLFYFCWLLVSFPFSLSIFYKIYVGSCVMSFGLPVVLGFVVYTFLEQCYLFWVVSGLSGGVVRSHWGLLV